MNQPTHFQPQASGAFALAELIAMFPAPAATWHLSESGDLLGHLHAESFEPMHVWAERLGGSIRAAAATREDADGRTVRTHTLSSSWRGVRVALTLALPVASLDARLAEQRHQLLDPPVMDPCSAARVAAAGIGVAA
ncbi:hypothetical protein QNO07_09670 [Streptomyces sp. 549]|uniref:hypothetical protein n=1 Tax=Streptomyces sp. 549 TaxID=3049076 RepID=UPI0024C41DDD|nr:hypothetical protein [Streptomyces sp. 549]MDK1473688.1 hypothetical protein [Streptomyces sp. 549]